jgi:superfamily I DNA/RNA helicase
VNPATSFIHGVPKRYRSFRRTRQAENSWYLPAGYAVTDLHALELDLILLSMLRNGSGALRRPQVRRDLELPEWAALRDVQATFRHQILVDEATDFSPVQLACMAALANPAGQSFFACGDFNQRLTTWGSRSLDEVAWACPGLSHQTITISYRQSSQLNELAKSIVRLGGGDGSAMALPDGVNNVGVAPLLVEQLASTVDTAAWLGARIREIEAFVKKLPSIAVLVMSEGDVQPLAELLNQHLADNNIRAVACRDGQTMGKENDVRVFDIQHIKGLEFEAVFFVGVDRLASSQPELFDKYLYVGTTRAATYLGMTCDGSLPAALEPLRPMFEEKWVSA